MPIWFIPPIIAAKWAALRFAQHGGDKRATWEALQNDMSSALDKSIGFVKNGASAGIDTTKIMAAFVSLRMSGDMQSLIAGTHALRRALDHLPEETRTGLRNSISLDERIEDALSAGMYYCGTQLLSKAPSKSESGTEVLRRMYTALYLIGRSGNTLKSVDAEACTDILVEIHTGHGGTVDRRVVQTLSEKDANATKLVAAVAAIQDMATKAPCIAFALRANLQPHHQRTLMEEILAMSSEG